MKCNVILKLGILAIFIISGLLSYSNILTSFFISDDFSQINRAIKYRSPLFFKDNLGWTFYRPIYFVSLHIDHIFWGLNPLGYHLVNIILHSFNAFFVFWLVLLLFEAIESVKKHTYAVAVSSGLLFLVLPSHTEAVTWIACRSDVLAVFFTLSAFIAYICFRDMLRISYYLISLGLFACALFTKESVIVLPFFIFFYEVYRFYIDTRDTASMKARLCLVWPYLFILFFYLIARYLVLGQLIGGYGVERHLPHNIALIAQNIVLFSARTLLPPGSFIKLIFAIICLTLLCLFCKSCENRSMVLLSVFLLGSFLIFLLPVIGLDMNYAQDTQGERFVYLPSAFMVMFIIATVYYSLRKTMIIFSVFSFCLIILYAAVLWKTNENWLKAGNISKNIVYSLRKIPKADKAFIISLPDTINGAYVFRNGFEKAVEFFVGRDYFKEIYILSRCRISSEDDSIAITSDGNDYNVQLISRNGNFEDVAYYFCDSSSPKSFTPLETTGQTISSKRSLTGFTFNREKMGEDSLVIFYSGKAGMRIVD